MSRREKTGAVAPSMTRRLACMLYEGVLLFGVVMTAGYLYSSLTQQRHALRGTLGLQAFLFVILGIYFTWFWSRSGQTLAMKTWCLRLTRTDRSAVSQGRALARYVLSWLWFLPALAFARVAQLSGTGEILASLFGGVAAYSGLALLRADRQCLHDAICDTCIIDVRPAPLEPTLIRE